MNEIIARDRLIVALDVPCIYDAEELVDELGDSVTFYKVGMELILGGGIPFVQELIEERGKKVFLDIKLQSEITEAIPLDIWSEKW